MSQTFHFKNFSYVAGNLRVEIKFDRFSRQFTEAQRWLGDQVLEDCKPYMPIRTGSMQQRSKVNNGGTEIEFPGPYARFQYEGIVMIGEKSGSPWARRGEHKVPTKRRLNYSSGTATSHWFDTAKAQHGAFWIEEVKRRAGGG